ncbi:MAG: hypothetical protein KDB14_34610 [Planctomycetales bacterium]|nr:hypothetical protein [Planctomycetales bacterium]
MEESPHIRFLRLLKEDRRYKVDAYQFVREALNFAQEELGMGGEPDEEERHLTGQELCEGIRIFAIRQFGYMAKLVLNSWGVFSTSDFGNLVYNLIEIEMMKKSEQDRREHFDDVFDFDEAFVQDFEMTLE